VAVFYRIQDLEKGSPDKAIITYVCASLGDIREEVSFWAIFQNNEGTFWIIHNLEHRDYVRMCGSAVMKLDFPGLEVPLSLVQRFSIGVIFVERLHGIPCISAVIESRVNNPIGASP
jgi:hypothetical protein